MELVWQDATQLLDKLAGGPVHFCGLSMGGFVGMRMAARRRDLVRSLILLETSSDPEPVDNIARYRMLTIGRPCSCRPGASKLGHPWSGMR